MYNYLVCNKFSGIHRQNSSFSAKSISASDLQNVELFPTGVNSGIGIRSSKGNTAVCDLIPQGEFVIDIFQSVQNGIYHFFVYTESESQGKLYLFNKNDNTLSLIKDSLSVTSQASACDFAQGFSDLFLFSNGVDFFSVQLTPQPVVNSISALDSLERPVKGLGLVNFDGRVWIFDKNILRYSVKEDFDDFATSDSDILTSAGYIEYPKNITAICPFSGSLIVFFSDASVILSPPYPFSQSKQIPAGCVGLNALTLHDTQLFFYDNTKNSVFSFKQIPDGDISLQSNIAVDLQKEFFDVPKSIASKIQACSVITQDKNEIWWLLPSTELDPLGNSLSTTLIFDYNYKEWLKRKSQKISCVRLINHTLFSAYSKIYQEYLSNSFDNLFIPSFYNCSPINFGSDNVIKILYYPPKLTLDLNYSNDFFVKYIKNHDIFNRIISKHIKSKFLFNVLYYDIGSYDSIYHYPPDKANSLATLPPTSFKILEMQFFTSSSGQEFAIKNLEFHRVKSKSSSS